MRSVTETDGVLLVDKAQGMTSHDVVAITRRALGTKKVGHCGTLDPLATGLLIITVGRGTKIQDLHHERGQGIRRAPCGWARSPTVRMPTVW